MAREASREYVKGWSGLGAGSSHQCFDEPRYRERHEPQKPPQSSVRSSRSAADAAELAEQSLRISALERQVRLLASQLSEVRDTLDAYLAFDPTPAQSLRLVQLSGSLDFWDHPDEDVYTLEDGEPL